MAGVAARGLDKAATDRIHVIDEPVLLHSPSEVDGLLATLQEQPVSLIVFDTLSRCFVGGEENNSRELGELIEGADRIRRATGATVLLVHHTTKDGNTERGSSALRGAADTMLLVDITKGLVKLECQKQKDAAPFETIAFKLIEAGGSCVVQVAGEGNVPSISSVSTEASATLQLLGTEGLRCKDWVSKSKVAPSTFHRRLKELKAAGLVTLKGALYVLTDQGQATLTLNQLSRDSHESDQ